MKHQNRYRLAIISSSDFDKLPFGGMTNFLKDITPILNNYFDIHIYGIGNYPGNKGIWTIKNIKGINIPFFRFSNLKQIKIIPNVFTVVFDLFKYKKVIKKNNYDALYFHGLPLSFPFILRKNNFKLINHIHGFGIALKYFTTPLFNNNILIKLYSKYRDYIIRFSDGVIVSADIKSFNDFALKYNLKKTFRINNFADQKIFHKIIDKSRLRNELNINNEDIIIITVGRLNKVKGYDLLINSFYLFLKHQLNSSLIIIGEGEERCNLESIIKNLKLSTKVKLLGYKEAKEIALWLNCADLFAFCSYEEAFPIALIEALCCGLPVISTDVVGVTDMVINGVTGYRIRQRNPDEFCQAMIRGLQNREELSKNAIELGKKYNPEVVGGQIANHIKSLLLPR